MNRSDPLHRTILLRHSRRPRQTLRPLLLRAPLLHPPLPSHNLDLRRPHYRLANFLPLRDILPGLAHLVQLDVLHSDDELSGHVCLLERYGHCVGHSDTFFAGEFCAKVANQQESKGWGHQYFWPRHLVSTSSHPERSPSGVDLGKY